MNEDQLHAVLTHSTTGLVVVDDSGRVRCANPRAHELFGKIPGSLINTRLPVACALHESARVEHPGADNRMLEINVAKLKWGGHPALLLSITDITRLKTSEDANSSHSRRNDAVLRLSHLLLDGGTLSELRHAAADILCAVLDVKLAAVFAYSSASNSALMVAGAGWRDNCAGHYVVTADHDSQIGQTLLTGNVTSVADWSCEQRFIEGELLRQHDVRSSISVVIPHAEQATTSPLPWGAVGVYATEIRTFTPNDTSFLRRVAFLLAFATQREHLLAREADNNMLLHEAGRVAKIGGWEADPAADHVVWSDEVSAIHDLPARKTVMSRAESCKYVHPETLDTTMRCMNELLRNGKRVDRELKSITATGREIWVRLIGEPIYDNNGRIVRARGAIQDITEQKHAREEIDFLALRDPLTGLPNRRQLKDSLCQAIANCRSSGRKAAFMLLDLDNFKTLNEIHGHARGDLLLQLVAERLIAWQRDGDTIARIGSDEFALIVGNLDDNGHKAAAQAEALASKLLDNLRLPHQLDKMDYYSTQSMGITMFGWDNDDAAELLKQADLTMHEAKARGRDRVCVYDPEMQEILKARATLEGDMRLAIQRDEFEPFYQPQVNAEGKIIGAEALVRWHHPTRGMLSPVEFISLAESSGLILHIGKVMLTKACHQLARWAAQPETAGFHLAVNVSAQQFHHPQFTTNVEHIIESSGADPKRLVLELTETSLLDDIDDTIAKMSALGNHGITFSLDDFGTGYSSLYYLKRLPLAQLKIDKSFVRNADSDPDNATIVRTVLALAGAMQLNVIAEGVETRAEYGFLTQSGCQAHQGFLFARPQPIEQFQALVEA